GIDVALVRHHGDLGAFARFANAGLDHDRAVIDLRHFHFKQTLEQFGRSARDFDLRSLRFLGNVGDHDADALTLVPLLAAGLLRTGQDGFQVPQIDDHVPALKTFDETIDQLADAIDVLLVNVGANRVADFLKQDLL